MPSNLVAVSREINSPVERVWQAWTNPDDLKNWFTSYTGETTQVIQFDVKVGGKVRLKFPGAAGEYTWTYIKIDRPSSLVIDILDFSLPDYQGSGGICNVKFEDLGNKSRVTVSGELPDDMKNDTMRMMAEKGWGSTLDRLNNFINQSKE